MIGIVFYALICLATYANEEASQVIQYIVREQEIDKKYKEQLQLHSFRFYPYGETSEVIKVSSRNMEDRRHVYCEIHKDALETLVYKVAKDKKAQEERAAKRRTEKMLVEQNMTVEQAIKWLRLETSKRLINEYELQGGNALAKVDEAIKIVCDYAESMRAKEKPYLN